jgi:hypothetical protein
MLSTEIYDSGLASTVLNCVIFLALKLGECGAIVSMRVCQELVSEKFEPIDLHWSEWLLCSHTLRLGCIHCLFRNKAAKSDTSEDYSIWLADRRKCLIGFGVAITFIR